MLASHRVRESAGQDVGASTVECGRTAASEYFEERCLPPPGPRPHQRLIHGLCLPLHVAKVLLADPEAKRRYLRVCIIQVLAIVGLGLFFMESGKEVADGVQERSARRTAKVTLEIGEDSAPSPRLAKNDEEEQEVREGVAAAQVAVEALRAGRLREATRHAEEAAKRLEKARQKAPREKRWREYTLTDLEFWAALLAAMHVTQWVIIALSRDYHDAIARDASLLTRLEPEDGPLQPRIRLDVSWLKKKVKRRWRALWLFLLGLPVLWLATMWMPHSDALFTVAMSAWGAWWYVVFTAAKSGRAWEDETAPAPWFLRGWTWLTTHLPGFRWRWPQGYGRFWERHTRSVFSPAATVEQQPWAFMGLALARAVGLVPGLKCFVRPLIPVASAHLLAAHRATASAALPAPTELASAGEPLPEPAKAANAP